MTLVPEVGKGGDLRPYTETVMNEGDQINATNAYGTIKITAGAGTRRTYEWDNERQSGRLKPRSTRWYGSLGIYGDTTKFMATPRGRPFAQGEEGRQFFNSVDEFLRWLRTKSSRYKPVWTSDGLVVLFDVRGDGRRRYRASVGVWQIYINGRKPHDLPGARPDLISITGTLTPDHVDPHDVEVGYERRLASTRLVIDDAYDPLEDNEFTNQDR